MSNQNRKEVENDPLMNEILNKSQEQLKIFDNFKILSSKGRIEVIFLYGFFYIRNQRYPLQTEASKMARLVSFLILKRKKLGLGGFFTFELVRSSLLQRAKDYNRHLANIDEFSLNTHSIYYSAIYNSPLKIQLDENVDLMDGITISVIVADMIKQLKA